MMNHPALPWRYARTCILPVVLFLLVCAAGCAAIGVVVNRVMPHTVEPKYTGMAGQSVAVMVWADRAIKIDWDTINSDLANAIQNKLFEQTNVAKELKETKWPWPAESVVRYQVDHPGIEALPIQQVAPRLPNVTRLIYVEIERVGTRGDASAQMYRGSVTANMKVVEIQGKEAKIGYEETGITAIFPKKSPTEGVLNTNDRDIYRGTMGALADEIVTRLITTESE